MIKRKKAGSLILAGFMALGLAACDKPAENNTSGVAKVYGMYATEKYMQDAEITAEENTKLNFVGIKNEIQSAQLTFTANEKITSFDLVTADLVEKDGETKISKDLIDVYAERYIEIYRPYMSDPSYISDPGFYPDALVPLDRYQTRGEDRVQKGENQAIWIDVNIPKDAKAGIYDGTFKLVMNEETVDISVSLKVYDLEMPEQVNAPSMFAIWYQQIAHGEGENLDSNTYQNYYEFLWSKRLNCHDVPPDYSGNMKDWLAFIETVVDNPKVTMYRIPSTLLGISQDKIRPKIEGTYTDEQIATEKNKIKNNIKNQLKMILDRTLELREQDGKETIDLLDKACYYYEDEPAVGIRTDCVKIFCELLHKAKKELATEYATQFEANPDLLESLMDVDEICPSNYFFNDALTVSNKEDGTPNYDLSDGLTWWCPEIDYAYNTAGRRAAIQKRQALGEKVWWYLCCSNTPRPSYYVESLPINIRMMSWMQYRYEIGGMLYWDIADFQPGQDMYEDIHYSSYGGGEGILVYPGARYGLKTPVSSWRLEQIRLGQQDYELFYMLNNFLLQTNSERSAVEVAQIFGEHMYNGTEINETTNSKQLDDYRIWLLDVLELFESGKSETALQMINELN